MACTPTRIELSNSATTTVQVTVASWESGDPELTVTLEVDGLSIDETAATSSGVATIAIAAVSASNNAIYDATIQINSNRPATAEVLVTETNVAQAVGITIDDSTVTYCAPSAGGGGSGTVTSVAMTVPAGFTVSGSPITTSGTLAVSTTLDGILVGNGAGTIAGDAALNDLDGVVISLPVAKQVLYYNGTDWRNVSLTSGDIPSLDASKITSGTFDDARIAESNVTQYASSIDLNDLGDVNIATGAGNDGDLITYDHAAGAGAKFKGVARSSIGLSEFDNDLPAVQDSYLMLIEAPSDKTYIIDGRVAAARTVTNFYAKTSSGTCTATLKNVTDTTTIGTISVTSTGGSAGSLSNTAVTENERLSIEISSNSSAADLEIVVEFTQ